MWFFCDEESTQNKLPDISLEYDAMLDVDYATKIRDLYLKTKIQNTMLT